jgi:putative endonuclease
MGVRQYFVYILSSHARRLYVGVTSDLLRRIWEHKQGAHGFTARYRIFRLVHFENTENVTAAITREKQIKGWSRAKKQALIERANPYWIDLAANWFR